MSEIDNEEFCYICRRPESQCGKLIKIPGNICICSDCMQSTLDTMQSAGFPGMGFGMDPQTMGFANTEPTGSASDYSKKENNESTEIETASDSGEDTPDKKDNDKDKKSDSHRRMPNISMINLSDLQGLMPNRPKVKTHKKDEPIHPIIELKDMPAPHKIKAALDEYVIGQEQAKKVMSVAVYNHYKRIASSRDEDGIEIEKSNMLMIGPTGSGKTYLVKTLARILNVPLAITDATSLTEAGYIGDDIESVVSKLLAAADNDVEKAEQGIIFIDEIDKIAKKKNTNQRDVSGESVQQGMLKLLEGSLVEVPVGASSKNAMVPMVTVDTKNILFICGGAFPDLEEIIKERLNKEASIGFRADLKDKYDDEPNLQTKVVVEDVRKYGMIPEFLGRLPVLFALEELTEDMLVEILSKPKNAILSQYKKLLAMDEVELRFDEEALHVIAAKAKEKKVGARALRAILEEYMLDIMYEIPKDDNIGTVTITKEYIEGTGSPLIQMRGVPQIEGVS
ncbi:MAG: ATP-dependent Clp protease ATP-binding subunit ClpX [Lachnospiraceae bacterium]|nr:ATP-dependent Clp protease ATP-binding subunit ClpX [Lachnospiraceae bacterium]